MNNSFKLYYFEKNQSIAEKLKAFLEKGGMKGNLQILSGLNKGRELFEALKEDESETNWFITIEENSSKNMNSGVISLKITDGRLGRSYRTTAELFVTRASMGPKAFAFH